jgi:hypothetical protein
VDLPVDTGKAFNVSHGESMSVDGFLDLLASMIGSESQIMRVERNDLESQQLLPDCSPFSGRWMSELDNSSSVSELNARYTSPAEYLPSIVEDYRRRWIQSGLVPDSYRRRQAEIDFAAARF